MSTAFALLKLFGRPLAYVLIATSVYFTVVGKARLAERQRLQAVAAEATAKELQRQLEAGNASLEQARDRAIADQNHLDALSERLKAARDVMQTKVGTNPNAQHSSKICGCRIDPVRLERLRGIK